MPELIDSFFESSCKWIWPVISKTHSPLREYPSLPRTPQGSRDKALVQHSEKKKSFKATKSLPLINFIQRWKMFDASEIIASNETHKERTKSPTHHKCPKEEFVLP